MKKAKPSDKCLIVLSMALVSLPLLLLLFLGEERQGFDGEKDYQRPAFSVAAFISGQFQEDFERWFSTKFPLRSGLVEVYGRVDAHKDAVRLVPAWREAALPAVASSDEAPLAPARFSDYVRAEAVPEEVAGYRGTAQVIIGKSGCLFENGYINEYLGYAKKYTNVTDEALRYRVATLKGIQDGLAARGIAFCVAITPSKAAAMPEYIPDWYTAKYTPAPDYVRPYTRFVQMLAEEGLFYVDSSALYRSVGLTNTFPKTGTHWTKMAAFETIAAVLGMYEAQTGETIRQLAADTIVRDAFPPGFGNSEADIFGVVYAGKKSELENAITDDWYYWPDVYAVNEDSPGIAHVTIQGGSFTDDFEYYFENFGLASTMTKIRYNNSGDTQMDWDTEISRTKFVILELNEQFVYNMGGNAPSWGQNDFLLTDTGSNIIDALYAYLAR